MTTRNALLVIDPQNDFCDLPMAWWPTDPLTGQAQAPALPVAGAHADMQRLAGFIQRAGAALSDITVTLDSHHRLDIAHPTFWQTGKGGPVAPFTAITATQVRAGQFAPRRADALPRCLAYLDALQASGRYTLVVWPVHCEMGTWGHNLHAELRAACNTWEQSQQQVVGIVHKGQNPWTEHYSAVMAEVPDAADEATGLNTALLAQLASADRLFIGGEASSHCVRATTEHLVAHLPAGHAQRLVLLTDAMSPVAGFEAQHLAFLQTMAQHGVGQMRCDQALGLMSA
jgi:nicotinamidase-related amidase